ncbi:MAG: hypothetical protein PUB85_04205 [Clostridia bacterium]|nr:hypothetical protein [Clostridia bacterium]
MEDSESSDLLPKAKILIIYYAITRVRSHQPKTPKYLFYSPQTEKKCQSLKKYWHFFLFCYLLSFHYSLFSKIAVFGKGIKENKKQAALPVKSKAFLTPAWLYIFIKHFLRFG